MKIFALIVAALCAMLVSCEKSKVASSPSTTPASASRATSSGVTKAEASPGRLLIMLTGESLSRNSAGDANSVACQLTPTATNESAVEIKSLHAEFTITQASDNTLVKDGFGLTMPIRIAPGATESAWGLLQIDNQRCEDLALKLNPVLPGACKTVSKDPCPAYALAATGVARAE